MTDARKQGRRAERLLGKWMERLRNEVPGEDLARLAAEMRGRAGEGEAARPERRRSSRKLD